MTNKPQTVKIYELEESTRRQTEELAQLKTILGNRPMVSVKRTSTAAHQFCSVFSAAQSVTDNCLTQLKAAQTNNTANIYSNETE